MPGNHGVELDLKKLKEQPLAFQRLSVRLSIEQLKGNTNQLSLIHLKEVEDLIMNRPVKSIVDLPGKISVQKDKKNIRIFLKKKRDNFC